MHISKYYNLFVKKSSIIETLSCLYRPTSSSSKGGIQQKMQNYLTYLDLSENLLASHYSSSFLFLSPFPDPSLLCFLISALNLKKIRNTLFRNVNATALNFEVMQGHETNIVRTCQLKVTFLNIGVSALLTLLYGSEDWE